MQKKMCLYILYFSLIFRNIIQKLVCKFFQRNSKDIYTKILNASILCENVNRNGLQSKLHIPRFWFFRGTVHLRHIHKALVLTCITRYCTVKIYLEMVYRERIVCKPFYICRISVIIFHFLVLDISQYNLQGPKLSKLTIYILDLCILFIPCFSAGRGNIS